MIDLDATLSGPLRSWVMAVHRHARTVLALGVLATLALGTFAAQNLGIDSNTIELFPEHLPARQNHDRFVSLFPDLENALLIVVDGQTPEVSREVAQRLVEALSADPEHFEDAYLPGGGAFFERNALLYQEADDLDEFADRLARAQPLIAELERDPSLANLTTLIRQGLDRIDPSEIDAAFWQPLLDRIGDASVEIYREHPLAISWESLLVEGSAIDPVTRRVVLAHPILDFSDALPARAPLAAIRAAVERIDAPPDAVRVRITGNPALVHEETLGLAWDLGVSGGVCLAIVALILHLALRSGALVIAVVATLLTGLVWTGAFAAAAVGNLNVISVAAGVLFLGLGVDFGLHLGMRYADLRRSGEDHATALDASAASVGSALVLCTMTTAIGFFSFLPTDYRGVAELGLITGVGLIIILFLTLTLLPALLTAGIRVDPAPLEKRALRFGAAPGRWIRRHAGALCAIAAVVALIAAFAPAQLRFDANIVAMRDPGTESVITFNDLLSEAGALSPWYANSIAANLEQADALKERMQQLDAVARSITLSDYVPKAQEEKVEILTDLSFLISTPGAAPPDETRKMPIEDQIQSLRVLQGLLREATEQASPSALTESMRNLETKLSDLVSRLANEDADADAELLERFESVLLTSLPGQIERVRAALEVVPFDRSALPERLERRLMAPDGRARVQTFPRENLEDHEAFERFVSAVQQVDPNATGIAVNLVEFARTTRQAFREAIATAVLVIATLLWVLWRRIGDTLLVLAPLGFAALVTAAVMVAIDLPLNFFNVVVVPLVLGAGVDSGIHLVEQARRLEGQNQDLLGTTTARAVLFSALTTITSFGSLALSSHVGIAGLGTLLTVGMSLTVVANLVLLPALIARLWRKPASGRG